MPIQTVRPTDGSVAHKISRPVRILCVVISELFIALMAGAMGILARANLDPSHPDRSVTPVLFLHGLHHNQSGMLIGQLWLRCFGKLRKQRLGSFYSLSYAGVMTNGRHETFATYADRAFRKVLKIYHDTGRFPHLVGHSMGGLVSTSLALRCEIAARTGHYTFEDGSTHELTEEERRDLHASTIVTLGTPFHGSPVADAACALQHRVGRRPITVYRNMTTPSRQQGSDGHLEELRGFAHDASLAGHIRYHNVGSTLDQFVPRGYFVTDDPNRQHEVHHLGHLGILWAPSIWSKVHRWLTENEMLVLTTCWQIR